ncbi:hypothetical protein FB451DRAFT_1572183 [Mycena latifolia]|nr:hypothetical protein FB451DRAFT_1572183 [Mycena latifolia]
MDTPAEEAVVELIRSTDFWYDDGTVVLQVENTLYRAYRGLVSSHSTIFRDTFAIPQPTEESTEIEGCAVVQLHDTVKDFTRFLKALHQIGFYPSCPVSGIAELGSVLRLSDKYDVPILRESMVLTLSTLYPTSSLNEWCTRTTPQGYTKSASDDIVALNLAVAMDIRSVLPAIMYSVCCQYDLASLLCGTSRVKIASLEYRNKCILAFPRLILAERDLLRYLTREEGDKDCDSPEQCDGERLRWLAADLATERCDPLADANGDDWDCLGTCTSCLDAAKAAFNSIRQQLWNELPGIFGLGTWEELLA